MITTIYNTLVLLLTPINFETGLVTIVADLGLNGTAVKEVNIKDLTATNGWQEIFEASNIIEAQSPFDTGLVYDQPAEATQEDVRRVLKMEYPTVYSPNGLGSVTNAGLMSAFFSTLAAAMNTEERQRNQ